MADWVFDSLVGYLQSPIWTYPVDSFLDHHCVGESNLAHRSILKLIILRSEMRRSHNLASWEVVTIPPPSLCSL